MTALQSHLVGNAEDPDIARAYHAAAGSQFAEVPIDGERYRVLRIEGAKNNTAYWVMQIPTSIVPNHGTIFRPQFRALLQAFLPPMPKGTSSRSCVDNVRVTPRGGEAPQLFFTRVHQK